MKLRHFAMKAQLDVPPLTLSFSPEYEGEGTGAGLRPESMMGSATMWSRRFLGNMMSFVVLFTASGCQWQQPPQPSADNDRQQSAQISVPPKQLMDVARQALGAPPMSVAVETGQDGTLLTGWKEYPGELHIVRRWAERTRFKIVILPDFTEPLAKSHVQVFDETQEKPSDAQPWYPAPDSKRPERSGEVLKLIEAQATRGNPGTMPG
ncbi:MAG: hypothetical protein JWL69_314, partial [Phycisphaerales bacterium]|nr:hypothetical protein [Phycisphaerales bacterium]